MGRIAASFFTQAESLGGLTAKMRLATLAKVTSVEASLEADSPPLTKALEKALELVREEVEAGASSSSIHTGFIEPPPASTGEAAMLRRHVETYLELMTKRSVLQGDVSEAVRRVTEASAATLQCQRVSVWFLNAQRNRITCTDLYQLDKGTHSSGVELSAKDFPPYFDALATERTIAAHDAHRDPRTSCFSVSYLKPLGINSMLDVPVWAGGKMKGVICHEHTGPRRTWNGDEERFAYLMSSFIALALERDPNAV